MAEPAYLTSALVTGVLLLAVWALVARTQNRRRYDVPTRETGRAVSDWLDSPAVWAAAFFLLMVVAGGGAVLLVSGASLPAALGGGTALVAVFGALLVAYLLWGTYHSARFRGLRSSQAALLSAWLFGSLFLAAIVVKLLVEG